MVLRTVSVPKPGRLNLPFFFISFMIASIRSAAALTEAILVISADSCSLAAIEGSDALPESACGFPVADRQAVIAAVQRSSQAWAGSGRPNR